MKKYDIISFHPGKQHNLEQAFQLNKRFKNFKHLTSLYFQSKTVEQWNNISPKIGVNLKKRSGDLGASVVDTFSGPELKMLVRKSLGHKASNADYIKRNELFQEWIIRNYAPPKVCIGFDTSSWLVFEKWKQQSFLILDLTIAIPQYKLTLAQEYQASEEFIYNQTKDDAVLYDVYSKELALADLILCGSSFVQDSCLSVGVDPAKLVVIPYGVDLTRFRNLEKKNLQQNKIKIVFIGNVNYRKGADIVLKAWERVLQQHDNVELHFFGNLQIELETKPDKVFFHGFINQDALIDELKTAHISILPSFLEGSSYAIYQSMAMGLAVITTPNAGSIVEDQKNGILIKYGSVDELTDALLLLIQDARLRQSLGQQAQQDVQHFTFDDYGRKLNSLLEGVLEKVAP
jgi:glycosyltransferase involved in cell wall biosynthesis